MSDEPITKQDLEYARYEERERGYRDGLRDGIELLKNPLIDKTIEAQTEKYLSKEWQERINRLLFGFTAEWQGQCAIEEEIKRLKALELNTHD
jgi:hypothetical protein